MSGGGETEEWTLCRERRGARGRRGGKGKAGKARREMAARVDVGWSSLQEHSWAPAQAQKQGMAVESGDGDGDDNGDNDSLRASCLKSVRVTRERIREDGCVLYERLAGSVMDIVGNEAEDVGITSIVCYGIGSPTRSRNARIQLAYIAELAQCVAPQAEIECFDPVMNSHDRFVMGELGIKVLAQNDQCKRSVGDARGYHFYMPTAPCACTAIAWANWEKIPAAPHYFGQHVFQLRTSSPQQLSDPSNCVAALAPHVHESILHDGIFQDGLDGELYAAFNDSSVMHFDFSVGLGAGASADMDPSRNTGRAPSARPSLGERPPLPEEEAAAFQDAEVIL